MSLKPYVLLISLGFCFTSIDAQSREKIVFNCPVSEQSSVFAATKELYQTAFDELGYDFDMQSQPGLRGLSNVSIGITDGECGRLKDFEAEALSSGLKRVDFPLLQLRTHLWTFVPELAAIPAATILSSRIRIAYVRGAMAAMNALQGYDQISVIAVNDFEQALRMLIAKRVDYVAGPTAGVFPAFELLGLSEPPLKAASLDHYTIYPYLSTKRSHLAAPLAQALKRQLDDPAHPFHQLND